MRNDSSSDAPILSIYGTGESGKRGNTYKTHTHAVG